MNILKIILFSARIILIDENFNEDWGPYGDNPPPGWQIIDEGNENPKVWNENDWHRYLYSTGNYTARVYWSPIEQQREYLISPSFDLSSSLSCSLYFWFNYQDYSVDQTDTGYVLLSLDGGSTWTDTLFTFVDKDYTDKDTFFDLTPYAGNNNCKICFLYKGNDDLYFMVDNVKVIKHQSFSHDVGVSQIIAPSEEILNKSIQIQVKVKNFGLNNETNVPVRCKIIKERTGIILFNQFKTISNLPAGAESTVIFNYVTNSYGKLIIKDSTELAGDQNISNDKKTQTLFVLKVINPDWEDNFDADSSLDLWFHSGIKDEWQIGKPALRGPSYAYSPPKCAATDTQGLYENNADCSLYSTYFDLTPFTVSDSIFISFYHFDSLENNYDYVHLEIKKKKDPTWTNLFSFTGEILNWKKDSFLIPSNFYGDTIQIRFHLVTDNSIQKAGFYMDNFEIKLKFGTPVIAPLEFGSGNYRVEWNRIKNADYYILYEAQGTKIFEDFLNSFSNWDVNYFILTEDDAFSEGYSFWSGEFRKSSPHGGITRGVDATVITKNSYFIDQGGAYIEFYGKWNIKNDIVNLEYSKDGGYTWQTAWTPNKKNSNNWEKIAVLIPTYGWTKFRFHYIGDDSLNPGFYFDNIKIYSLSSFSMVATTPDTFYNFLNKPTGLYFYKVKAFSNTGRESRFSNTEDIIVKNLPNTPPSITLLSPSANIDVDGYFFIRFNANDVDDPALISIYYDNNRAGYDGILYSKWIVEKDGIDSFRVDGRNISLNNFYIYLMITDITDTAFSNYSARVRKINLTIPNEVSARGKDTIYNRYVRIIHRDDGSDGTIGHLSNTLGDTLCATDDSINILFGPSFDPWSSDAVIRVDGKSYIFGKTGEGRRIKALTRLIGNQGIPTTQPSNPSMPDNSVGLSQRWWYDGVEVRQDLIFAYGKFSYHPNYFDQILCRFILKNVSVTPKSVALKMQWDLEIETEDGAITKPSGDPLLYTEWRYTSDVMREFYICQDSTKGSTTPPIARTIGYINNWGVATPPDEFLIINWRHLNSYPGLTYRVISEDSLDIDSGLDLIWYPKIIKPGDSVIYSTYYGSVRYDILQFLGYEEEEFQAEYKPPFVILRWRIKEKYKNLSIFRQKEGAQAEKIFETKEEINLYKDIPELPGEYLYKISFELFNGKIKEMGPIKISVKEFPLKAKLLKNIFHKEDPKLIVSVPKKGTLKVKIFDTSGRETFEEDITLLYPDSYSIRIPNKLRTGTYFLEVLFEGKRIHKEKFIILH